MPRRRALDVRRQKLMIRSTNEMSVVNAETPRALSIPSEPEAQPGGGIDVGVMKEAVR